MIELKQLRLNNYALFRDQQFDFEPGMTAIYGHNRSGKSLLFSSIRPLLFGLASGERLPKGSTVELDFNRINIDSKQRLRIVAESPKATPDWKLFINRQDMATHRKGDARALIDSQLPTTGDLFDCVTHIAANKDLPLAGGTAPGRLDWLSSVFNLAAIYNAMGERVSQLIDELVRDDVRLKVLQDQLIPQEEPVDEAMYAKLEKRHATLKKQITSWQHLRQTRETIVGLEQQLKIVSRKKTDLTVKSEIIDELDSLETRLEQAEKNERRREKYAEQLSEYQESKEQRDALLQKLPDEWRPSSSAHLRELTTRINKKLRRLEDDLASADENNRQAEEYRRAVKYLKAVERPKMKAAEAKRLIRTAEQTFGFAKRMLDKLNNSEANDNCPECGTKLTAAHVKSVRKDYQKQVVEAKEQMDACQQALDYYDLREIAKDRVVPVNVAELKSQSKSLRAVLQVYDELSSIPVVAKPEKPSIKKGDYAPWIKARANALRTDLSILEANAWDISPDPKGLQERIAELRAELSDIDLDEIEQLADKAIDVGENLQVMRLRRQRYLDAEKHNAKLQEEIASLQVNVRRLRPLRVLKEACSRSGVVLMAMQDAIEQLLQELNRLAPMLIDEKFRVDIVTGPRKLDVMIERNGALGSIRTLSMSEQRCWQLLFAAAMIQILPNNMLFDTIILDELESNMDDRSKARYTTEFLPYLQTLIPKIIVISPLASSELKLQPDRVYRVEKKDRVSTLRRL